MLQLAAGLPPGGLLLAADRHAGRLAAAVRRAREAGLASDLLPVVSDLATAPALGPRIAFDGVLVDAPCTGTGTLRRHPELRWRLAPGDPARLGELQGRLLANAAAHVRAGGRLVYSVCSLEPEEGPEVIERFVAADPGFSSADARRFVPPAAVRLVAPDGTLRTSPVLHGLDGFFAAVLERTPSRR
jgi:16S rRNA (cytosine967-C5)-methyltransferase